MRIIDYRPATVTRAVGLRLYSYGTCRAEISFGNRYNVEEEGIRCDHLSVMTVGCHLPVGHSGPHQAERENYEPAESIDHLADRVFTLTWEDS